MEHTPGPWVFNESNRQITGNNDDGCIIVREVMHQIYDEQFETEEMKANAKLITAAPDLLEACRIALERLPISNCEGEEDEFIEMLEKAIQKAEGK